MIKYRIFPINLKKGIKNDVERHRCFKQGHNLSKYEFFGVTLRVYLEATGNILTEKIVPNTTVGR